jgi:hypothetical protein
MRLGLTLLLSTLLAACFPYRYTDRPGIVGQVISVVDGRPITGASVSVTFSHPVDKHGPIETSTAADGTFAVEAKTKWGLFIVPQESGPPGTCTVKVLAGAYHDSTREFRWWGMGRSVENLGSIELRPLPETPDTSFDQTRDR